MSKRKRIGIIVDYSIRIPEFVESYKTMREQMFVDADPDLEADEGSTLGGFWSNLKISNPEAQQFYEKVVIPTTNYEVGFDITYRKYFYNEEHRQRFLNDWSYNLFAQGSVTNKADITNINLAQTHLFDVVLIDRATHTRKITNTFAFLARAGLFVKQVMFVNNDKEIQEMADQFIGIWNPAANSNHIILPANKVGEPTKEFLDWLMEQEKKTKAKA